MLENPICFTFSHSIASFQLFFIFLISVKDVIILSILGQHIKSLWK
jgi:hypothetical protein